MQIALKKMDIKTWFFLAEDVYVKKMRQLKMVILRMLGYEV